MLIAVFVFILQRVMYKTAQAVGEETSRVWRKKLPNVPFLAWIVTGLCFLFVFSLLPFSGKPSWLSSNEVLCLFQVPSKPFLCKHSQNQLKEMKSKVYFISKAQSSAAELNCNRKGKTYEIQV